GVSRLTACAKNTRKLPPRLPDPSQMRAPRGIGRGATGDATRSEDRLQGFLQNVGPAPNNGRFSRGNDCRNSPPRLRTVMRDGRTTTELTKATGPAWPRSCPVGRLGQLGKHGLAAWLVSYPGPTAGATEKWILQLVQHPKALRGRTSECRACRVAL